MPSFVPVFAVAPAGRSSPSFGSSVRIEATAGPRRRNLDGGRVYAVTEPAAPASALVTRAPPTPPSFGETPFPVRNGLAGHPLFSDERIEELLRRLPRARVEIRRVTVDPDPAGGWKRGPMDPDVDPVAAFRGLAQRPTWMLLHDTWKHDAGYRDLLEQYLAELSTLFPELAPGVSDLGCWMFLSSGRSVVHFHADPDQSFLNQVRGGKTVFVYPARVLPEKTVEELVYAYDQGVVTYDPAYEPQRFEPVHLSPGESVFLPLYAPHRVINDDTVCVSWNVGFNTARSRRRRDVHCVNLELRHLGLTPTPWGRRPRVDAMKRASRFVFKAKNRLLPFTRPKIRV